MSGTPEENSVMYAVDCDGYIIGELTSRFSRVFVSGRICFMFVFYLVILKYLSISPFKCVF